MVHIVFMNIRACHHFIFMELDFFHMIFCCLKVHEIQRKKEIIDFQVPMFKNHLDIYLDSIPDQPTIQGLARSAKTNSLLDQVPLLENNSH